MRLRLHWCSFDSTCQLGGRIDRLYLHAGDHTWWLDLLRWRDRGHSRREPGYHKGPTRPGTIEVGPAARAVDSAWRARTATRSWHGVPTMLVELDDMGFARRDVAAMLGDRVSRVASWRGGKAARGGGAHRVAALLAACDLVGEHRGGGVASWFETPVCEGAPLTPLVLYSAGRADLVFALSSGRRDADAVLTVFDPDWRERYTSDFEVFRADDGSLSIRAKER